MQKLCAGRVSLHGPPERLNFRLLEPDPVGGELLVYLQGDVFPQRSQPPRHHGGGGPPHALRVRTEKCIMCLSAGAE
ncbi:unnamed protein product [Menidia menidia]|uniref:(Atlantic silverside) hypothetical protein n=1 Tax=Menidia menidia TaxID=238744 RepID=A0A8S4AT49_9TELE|nr:unnamed protein product [Menidia menidia]